MSNLFDTRKALHHHLSRLSDVVIPIPAPVARQIGQRLGFYEIAIHNNMQQVIAIAPGIFRRRSWAILR